MFNAEKIKNECVAWIREFFENNGKNCNAVLGISGGKDSSIAAALCVEALGKDRVIGVLMPQGEQHDIDKAYVMGFEFSNAGKIIGWSPFFSMQSKSKVDLSFKLPAPTNKKTKIK